MHVVQLGFHLDAQARAPEVLLRDWHTLVDTAEAAAGVSCRVSVVQASQLTAGIQRNGVDYHFLPAAARPFNRGGAVDMSRLLRQLQPDVIHVHGLGFPRHVGALESLAPDVPVMLQDHADRLPGLWRRRAWRHGHRAVAGAAFCSAVQAQPFQASGLLGAGVKVFEIPESTSRFTPGDQAAARGASGLRGTPALLWVGHLNSNKDPLTVLHGFRLVLEQLSQAELWMCFGSAPLMSEIRGLLKAHPQLSDHVHLLGHVPHADVQQLMRAADLYVSGSHREGSGYALIEALATGLVPVVTDIPSFRSLTAHGSVGELWRCGDATELSQSLLSVARRRAALMRAAASQHFNEQLSSAALGRKLREVYSQLGAKRRVALPT